MSIKNFRHIALIVAAGSGARIGGDLPKQYHDIAGQSVLARIAKRFLAHPEIDAVAVVIDKAHIDLYQQAIGGQGLLPYIIGGKRRQDSVRLGLAALEQYNPEFVLIHDAARIFTKDELISELLKEVKNCDGAIPVCSIVDTVKLVDHGIVLKTLPRGKLSSAQTPQVFRYDVIMKAHNELAGQDFTDDASLLEQQGKSVKSVMANSGNFKITTIEDLTLAKLMLEKKMKIKVGMGFDAHKFDLTPDDANFLMLGGVQVPHQYKLLAHSDGDVVLHALVDAMFGAIGAGDIGLHFPPSDNRWKNEDSSKFVEFAYELICKAQGVINNVDITVICEAPKISEVREQMQARIAKMLKLAMIDVNIKATTTEKMGFTGRKEGIACQAVVTVVLPQ